MADDDLRVEWIRQRVNSAFRLWDHPECFDELLNREDGRDADKIVTFLDEVTPINAKSFLVFFKTIKEEEVEVKIPIEASESSEESAALESESEKPPGAEPEIAPEAPAVEAEDVDREEANQSPEMTEVKAVHHIDLQVFLNDFPEKYLKFPAFFFKRNKREEIVQVNDVKETHRIMCSLMDYDLNVGKSLYLLQSKIMHLNKPLFSARQRYASGEEGELKFKDDPSQKIAIDDMVEHIHKMLPKINATIHQIEMADETQLYVPDLALEQDIDVMLSDSDMVEEWEQCVLNWQTQITIVIQEQENTKPEGPGPLAEVAIWEKRSTVLGALCEQLRLPVVEKILRMLWRANPEIFDAFDETASDLANAHLVSNSNARYLKTVERHFMNMAVGANFSLLLETIPPLMERLQTMWMSSRHYNTKERMVPLMERIAWLLCENVSQGINVPTLFKGKAEDIKSKVVVGKEVLEKWKQAYFDNRAEIEKLGRSPRWEFDRERLFKKTDYMASVCDDLTKVFQVLEELKCIFGPELKSIKGIDEVTRKVDGLVLPFESIDFDPFDMFNMSSWRRIMQIFHTTVKAIERKAINFIDLFFKNTHSSAHAFDMLMRFRKIGSREAINEHLVKKFDDILLQYCKEVEKIKEQFEAEKGKPPLNSTKSEPPVSGAIRWARTLVESTKQPIIAFLKVPEILNNEKCKVAKDKYVELALQIKEYQDKKYANWLRETEHQLPSLIKQTLLIGREVKGLEVLSTKGVAARNLRYSVNFAPHLKEITAETKYLVLLGYTVHELAQSVALQEEKYIKYVFELKGLVTQYNAVMDSLTEIHRVMLAPQIAAAKKEMNFGCRRINWSSSGVPDFISRGIKAVSNLEGVLNQARLNEKDIESKLHSILSANLLTFPLPDKARELQGIRDFCEYTEKERIKTVALLSRKYTDIGLVITKTEHLVMNTNSGNAKTMETYYSFWEQKVLDALIRMVLRSIYSFNTALMGNTPCFQVKAILSAPKVVVQPKTSEISALLLQCIKNCIESTKQFPRWMRGTCIECPPQKVEGEDEMVSFTFFTDVWQSPLVCESVHTVSQNIKKLLGNVDDYLNHWKRYRSLLKTKVALEIERFAKRNPTCATYDSKLQYFSSLSQDVGEEGLFRDECIIHLNLEPLIESLSEIARSRIVSLCTFLHKPAKEDLFYWRDKFKELHEKLQPNPNSYEELKFLLGTISEIRDMAIDVDISFAEIRERYRMLAMYNMEVTKDELDLLAIIGTLWSRLMAEAKQVDRGLSDIKRANIMVKRQKAEEFRQNLAVFAESFYLHGPGAVGEDLEKGLNILEKYRSDFAHLLDEQDAVIDSAKLLHLPLIEYPEIVNIQDELEGLRQIYSVYEAQKDAKKRWSQTLWKNADILQLQTETDGFLDTLKQLPQNVQAYPVALFLESTIKEFRMALSLLLDFKNDAVQDRHWHKLMDRTETKFEMKPDLFTLGTLFALDLHNYPSDIAEIINYAVKERGIEEILKSVIETWEKNKFTVHPYYKGNQKCVHILGSVDDILLGLDEDLLQLQCMAGNMFSEPFLHIIEQWEKNLTLFSETIEVWLQVQHKWMYLDNIFFGEEISSQLANETKKLENVEKKFTEIMKGTETDPKIKPCCMFPDRFINLCTLRNDLESMQKNLSSFLDAKRKSFPRFFLISDDDLLKILGTGSCDCIQEHIMKIFENVTSLKFETDCNGKAVIGAMISAEGEELEFRKPVPLEGKVENWMTYVLQEVKSTTRLVTKEAIYYYCRDMTRWEWMMSYPGVVVLIAEQVWWTWEVEDAIKNVNKGEKYALKECADRIYKQIDELVVQVTEPMTQNDRLKINNMLIIDVHSRDIVDSFVGKSIISLHDFEWDCQLRFYWVKERDNLFVRQCNVSLPHGYEYMGLSGRLVITPLTNRIFLTLTQALSTFLGGALVGSTGTGKTEIPKDLAKTLGLRCVVTNCTVGMDYITLGKMVSGLAQCGFWGCFDGFNCIDPSTISVVSSQIQAIRSALMSKFKTFQFEGRQISLDSQIGIFITMDTGSTKRAELPGSAKVHFRPVATLLPDMQQICEIILFSHGFLKAKQLARKMTALYKLASVQLSNQSHYDFGLHSMKAVLTMTGNTKRESPELSEDLILMRTFRDTTMVSLVHDDVPLFYGLILDLFPGLECPRVTHPTFSEAVKEVLEKSGYIILPDQVDNVMQMYETMMVQHTTVVVGPTSGGKSVIINTLCQAQTKLGLSTRLYPLNPKAVTLVELYGARNPVTQDWSEGILSKLFREINKLTDKQERRYIVFDGDVDPLWVENINSVMDDNKLLTLATGERISLQNHCSLLFEVGNLDHATPSTASRCGVVFVDPRDVKFTPYWQKWVKIRSEEEQETLNRLFDKYVKNCMKMVASIDHSADRRQVQQLKSVIPLTDVNLITQFCSILDALLESENIGPEVLESFFLEALYCSLGANLEESCRITFDEYVKGISALTVVKEEETLARPGEIPGYLQTLYDFHFDGKKERWVPWSSLVPEYVHDPEKKFSDILVPTADTTRTFWILQQMMKIKKPVLLVGDSGGSKTAIINHFLRTVSSDINIPLVINFSNKTSSLDLQRNLETNVEKRTIGTYGPPRGKKLMVFIDDLNMPEVDDYGTQQPIALLKLLLDQGGMYDRQTNLRYKVLIDLHYMVAMGRVGGGRKKVDPRFISLFSVFNITTPAQESLHQIYLSIIKGHTRSFQEDIREVCETVTACSLKLFDAVVSNLPGIPSKFHYVFNVRDLSRVFYGLTLTQPGSCLMVEQFVRVWRNECLRTFHDRLSDDADKALVHDHIRKLVEEHFKADEEAIMLDPILFGDFRTALQESDPRIYEDIGDYEISKAIFQDLLEQYIAGMSGLNLVLFDDAIEHLIRAHRIIRSNCAHGLLIGVGGSGKESLARLAAFTAGCEVFQVAPGHRYNELNFREDLKTLYIKLGVENIKTVFLFSDNHIVEERFLELVNNMLTAGFVPALYTEEEKAVIFKKLLGEVKKKEGGIPKESLWKQFISRSVENLHIVLSMSPVGNALKTRFRNFPGLMKNTIIDWYMPWMEESLQAVAKISISDNPQIPEDYTAAVIDHMCMVHSSMDEFNNQFRLKLRRCNHVTSENFMDYIGTFFRVLKEKDESILAQCDRLESSLDRMTEARQQIADLNVKLAEQKEILAIKSAACTALLEEIAKNKVIVKEKMAQAKEKAKDIEEQNKVIAAERKEAELSLAEAMPTLEAAHRSLQDLDSSDITEIRSFAKPPKQVQAVCESILVLRGYKEISWHAAKKMMSESNFLRSLLEMDCDTISTSQMSAVRDIINNMHTSVEEMQVISKAGSGILKFVGSFMSYWDVAKEVKPKREKLGRLEKEFQISKADLERINNNIESLHNESNSLKEKYDAAVLEKEQQIEEAKVMERRLAAADKLVSGLTSENDRWTADLEQLKESHANLLGDCLVSAAFLSYAGPFTRDFREEMIYEKWMKDLREREIPLSQPFKIENILSDEVEISRWVSEGLPPDEQSAQNGILTTKGTRFPLFIDPQQQAIEWIRKKEENSNLKIASANDPEVLKKLELCIKYGSPLILQDVDEIVEPTIENVLTLNVKEIEGRHVIFLGDHEVNYDPNFKLYLHTRLGNPHYKPSVYGRAMIINCTVTLKGLEDQFLSLVISYEKKALQIQFYDLIQEISDCKKTLKSLGDHLLLELATSTGNILDNTELIQTLEKTKSKVLEVYERLTTAQSTSLSLVKVREGYRPVAKHAAVLYFALADMSMIDTMYGFSLLYYTKLLELSLQKSMNDMDLQKRIANILDALTENVHSYGCAGLFEKHRLLFSLNIALRVKQADHVLPQEHLDFLIRGNPSIDLSESEKPLEWIPDQVWLNVLKLAELFPSVFGTLPEEIEDNSSEWESWYELVAPEQVPFPLHYEEDLSAFQSMLLLRCFRVDRLIRAVNEYVAEAMGKRFIEPVVISFTTIYERSSPVSPILFILSSGSDPTNELVKFAEYSGRKYKLISMGQGQEEVVLKVLDKAVSIGSWLILQNCHLLGKWLVELDIALKKVTKPNLNFRLWMTTSPTEEFPIGLLHKSQKIVVEPPHGIRLNMKAAYSQITHEMLSSCEHPSFGSLVYVQAFFHAIIQEREKFGKTGWNVPCIFTESDFSMGLELLKVYLTKAHDRGDSFIPWEAIQYLLGEVIYGGRAFDSSDRKVLSVYMHEYFGDFLFSPFQQFHLFKNEEVDYIIPPPGPKNEYVDEITNMPLVNTAEIAGFHSNVEIGYYTQTVETLWTQLQILQPGIVQLEESITTDEHIIEITQGIQKRLPELFDLGAIHEMLISDTSPTTIVLLQELERFNALLVCVHKSVSDLLAALAGEGSMSCELDKLAQDLWDGCVPSIWKKLAPDTLKPLSDWLGHLKRRHDQYKYWVDEGEPKVMWLSGLHIPESYLAALVQTAARKNDWPLEESTFYTEVTEYVTQDDIHYKLKQGCYVTGLFLEGAEWDKENGCLVKSRPKVLVVELPILKVTPVPASRLRLRNTFRAPVYTTSQRRSSDGKGLVFEADLNTTIHISHWVLPGVCMYLNTD